MTVGQQVEMLFKLRVEGSTEAEKLAGTVQGVSVAATTASARIDVLEKSISGLTAVSGTSTAALTGLEGALDRTAAGTTRLGGGARIAAAELRMLEGAMPVRAAAMFLTQMTGLNAVMSVAFPVFGAVALVGVLDTILEKTGMIPKSWDEASLATKRATDDVTKYGDAAHKSLLTLRGLQQEVFTKQFGPVAGASRALEASGTDVNIAQQKIRELEKQRDALNRYISVGPGGLSTNVSGSELGLLQRAGFEPGQGQQVSGAQIDVARTALKSIDAKIPAASADAAIAKAKMELATLDLGKEQDKTVDKQRSAADKAQKQAEAAMRDIAQLQGHSQDVYSRSILGSEPSIYRNRDAALEKIGQERSDALGKHPGNASEINAAYDKQTAAAWITFVDDSSKALKRFNEGLDASEGHIEETIKAGQKKQLGDLDKTTLSLVSGGLIGGASILAPPDGYHSPQEQMRLDKDSLRHALQQARGGSPNDIEAIQKAGANAEYEDQLRINELKLKGNDLELANLDALATKKQSDFEAEQAREQALQTLRERDTQKYEQIAGGLFDALRNHNTSQWGREMLIGQARQMFTNAATPVLQNAGHMLGGMIPGQTNADGTKTAIGQLLSGTMLDSGNKDTAAKDTATNTKETVKAIRDLQKDLRTLNGASPDAGGIAIPDIFNLPMLHGAGNTSAAIMGALLGGGGSDSTATSGMSALFQAGGGSTYSQFMSGLGAGSLEAAVTGWSGHGSTGTQLTSTQRAGAAVSTGAQMAGQGISAAQGFAAGGAKGDLQGASGVLGMAAAIPTPASPFLAAASVITGIISSLLGDSKQARMDKMAEEIFKNTYLAPTALNVLQGMDGTYEDFGSRGNIRTSTMSAVPTVAQPYITSQVVDGQRTYSDVAGGITRPYSGYPTGTGQAPVAGTTTININAMDVQSFNDFIRTPGNENSLGEAVASHLERQDGRLAHGIRFITGAS
jgi:hypothetical protein